MNTRVVLVLVAFVLLFGCFDCSHFRGGIITYKPSKTSPNTIDFSMRLAYRRSRVYCDNTRIANQQLLYTYYESWQLKRYHAFSSTTSGAALYIYCSCFDAGEDWIEGYNNFTFSGSQDDLYWDVRVYGGGWIGAITHHSSSSVNLLTRYNLTARLNNSSPVSNIPLTVYVEKGIPSTITIPVHDPDGDIVRCRNPNYQDCYQTVCTYWPYGSIHEENCSISYDGGGTVGQLFPIYINLEDYANGATLFEPSTSLGSVDLQFIIHIVNDNAVRLQAGDYVSGRLEVLHNGVWGTVCDDGWTMANSHVACRQLGFPSAISFTNKSGSSQILLDDVRCIGNETSIQQCRHNGWGIHNCGNNGHVHLICSNNGTVRLQSGNHSSGRLEILHKGVWGTVCISGWTMTNSHVACRQLGFKSAVSFTYKSGGTGQIWLNQVRCNGHETSIQQCSHNGWGTHYCGHYNDVHLTCLINECTDYLVLKSHDRSQSSDGGYTGYCDHNEQIHGVWYRFMGDAGTAIATSCVPMSRCGTNSPGWMNGSHPTQAEGIVNRTVCYNYYSYCCYHRNNILAKNCGGFYVYQLMKPPSCNLRYCGNGEGNVRLEGENHSSGRLEVFHNGVWGTVCSDGWTMTVSHVACRELGFPSAVSFTNKSGAAGQIWLDDVRCIGNETSISKCRHSGWGKHNCRNDEHAHLICSNNVRLQGGNESSSGRLEVFHNGAWGTVCDNSWTMTNSHVACRQLGFLSALEFTHHYSSGGRQTLLDNVLCSGHEKSIQQCSHNRWGYHCWYREVHLNCSRNECTDYLVLKSHDRSQISTGMTGHCDHNEQIHGVWYRFMDDAGTAIATSCVPTQRCGTQAPGWMNGSHPTQAEGIVNRTVCYHWSSQCCNWQNNIRVKNCGGFNVYQLIKPPGCNFRYCGNGEGNIRLEGEGHSSGRLEVLHNGAWGTVCSDSWNMTVSHVACRQLGFPSAVSFTNKSGATGQIWLDDVRCSGNETSISKCRHSGWGKQNCRNDGHVHLICSNNVRLQGGNESSSGRLEVFHNGAWGTVCDYSWTMTNSHVACRQLGFLSGLEFTHHYSSGLRSWLDYVRCSGHEKSIKQCSHNIWGHHCWYGEVHLNCSRNECTDYLDLNSDDRSQSSAVYTSQCDHNEQIHGVWYRFMDDAGTDIATSCVPMYRCGTDRPGWMNGSHPTQAEGIVNRTVCYNSYSNCCYYRNNIGVRNCGGFYVYQLMKPPSCNLRYCGNGEGNVRLQGGDYYSGRLEVFHNGIWGTVCYDGWTMSNSHVVCRHLRSSAVSFTNKSGATGQVWLDDVRCIGNETSILKCRHSGWENHNCGNDGHVHLICLKLNNVRLQGGDYSSGRLEVLHNGVWGTVCDDGWSMTNSHVACRQLGFTSAVSFTNRDGATGQIWLDWVRCNGYETSIQQCQHYGWGVHYCSHYEDVHLECMHALNATSISSSPSIASSFFSAMAISSAVSQSSSISPSPSSYVVIATSTSVMGHCASSPCRNGGTCRDTHYGYYCSCHHRYTGQQCETISIRLQGGNSSSGRLEVLHNGGWGTVCDDYWYSNRYNSHVACRQLGFESAVSVTSRNSGATGQILLDDVRCNGNESSIQQCQHRGWGAHNCGHSEDVHLNCFTNVSNATSISSTPSSTYSAIATSTAAIGYCASSPCHNGGTCRDTHYGYYCSCPHHYTGQQCETNSACEFNGYPCLNGGTCYGYYCGCPDGYTGRQCETNLKLSVKCEDHYMEINLTKSYFPNVDWRNLHLINTSCRATTATSNTITLRTPLDGCGTTYIENNDTILFENEVSDDQRYKSGNINTITRVHLIVLSFHCKYSRRKLVSTSFSPSKKIIYASEGNFGNFTFTMNLYKTSSYQTPYSPLDYPVPVSLNEPLWIQFEVKNTINDLVVFAESCRATTSANPNSLPQYRFLEQGCVLDSTMRYIYNQYSSVQHFSIKSFDFVYSNNQLVYLHCELMVCHRNSANSRCSSGCISSRRRREAPENKDSSKKYELSVGPFKKESKASKNAEQVNNATIGTSAGLGVVGGLLLIVCGVLLFKKLRKVCFPSLLKRAYVAPSPSIPMEVNANSYEQNCVVLDEKPAEIEI